VGCARARYGVRKRYKNRQTTADASQARPGPAQRTHLRLIHNGHNGLRLQLLILNNVEEMVDNLLFVHKESIGRILIVVVVVVVIIRAIL
jgi:hypothetical protein